jgi:tetrahydromethanopterin S-methyltransferase subunit E
MFKYIEYFPGNPVSTHTLGGLTTTKTLTCKSSAIASMMAIVINALTFAIVSPYVVLINSHIDRIMQHQQPSTPTFVTKFAILHP